MRRLFVGGILPGAVVASRMHARLRARRMYIRAKRRNVTPYSNTFFDPLLNLVPMADVYEAFEQFVQGVEDALRTKGADTSRALEVATHLLRECPDLSVKYNAWYVLYHARGMEIVDEHHMPA